MQHACVALDENQVFIWGGYFIQSSVGRSRLVALQTGAICDRVSNSWTSVPTANAPSARAGLSAIRVGNRVIVFGGRTYSTAFPGSLFGSLQMAEGGGIYDVANQTWSPLPSLHVPAPRYLAKTLKLEDEVLFFGGRNASDLSLSDGALFNVAENRWRSITSRNAPGPTSSLIGFDNALYFWSGRANDSISRYIAGIPAIDRDDEGWVDAHELYLGTDPDEADTNDDGIADGDAIEEELTFCPSENCKIRNRGFRSSYLQVQNIMTL